MKAFYLATLLDLLSTSFAKNDWTQACLNGACSYDVEEDSTSMGGSIEISGSPSAISDITSAAGWSIANCTDITNSQTIQIVCTNESKGCGHIFQDGAQDTIVRLPENCGSGPFVRVVNHWVPDDQSVPTSLVTKRAASSTSMPQVHILEIDGNFDQTSGIHGNVTFELHAQGNLRPDAKHQKRQNGSGFTSTPFSVSNADTLIFNDNMLCPSANGQTNFIFRGDLFLQNVTFQTNISIISRGTLSPPSISSLSFSAPTDAVISGFVQPSLSLQGTINVIDKQIMGMAFPSFTIADVVSVQPSFSIIANAVGKVQRFANCVPNMGFNYEINDLQFAYPSNNPVASVEITTPPSQFVAIALPSENANAQITMNSTFKFLTHVSAFGQSVDLSVSYNITNNMGTVTTPGTGNDEVVCFDLANQFQLVVANSGPFFQAFSGPGAQTIFEEANTVLSTCQTVPLGPSPPTRRTASPLDKIKRDIFSCPPVAAVAQQVVQIIGSFPP